MHNDFLEYKKELIELENDHKEKDSFVVCSAIIKENDKNLFPIFREFMIVEWANHPKVYDDYDLLSFFDFGEDLILSQLNPTIALFPPTNFEG